MAASTKQVTLALSLKCSNCGNIYEAEIQCAIPSTRFSLTFEQILTQKACKDCGQFTLVSHTALIIFENFEIAQTCNYDELANYWVVEFDVCEIDAQQQGTDGSYTQGYIGLNIISADKLPSLNGNISQHKYISFKGGSRHFMCPIRHPGSKDSTLEDDSLEVIVPELLNEDIYYSEFREAAVSYYKATFGEQGTPPVYIQPGVIVKNLTVGNSRIHKRYSWLLRKRGIQLPNAW
ncbi:MAG: hypothetical protein ACRYFZ_09760 [Janthinobacterium lividum]